MPAAWEIEQSVAPDLSFPLLAGPSSQYDDECLMQGADPGIQLPTHSHVGGSLAVSPWLHLSSAKSAQSREQLRECMQVCLSQ